MNTKLFISGLAGYQGSNVFNPYSDVCEVCDKYNAPTIRRNNIKFTIDALLLEEVDSIWIGRDLGYRGGRRTGLALTDECHLGMASQVWGVDLKRATKGAAVAERTAANIWGLLSRIESKIFMWNVFPFHPYEEGNQFTNRSHNAKERDIGIQFLEELVLMLNPNKIVAIGNDAHISASRLFKSKSIMKIRHPSYGGEKDFKKQITEIYNLKN